jgi:hypothetical protein
VSNAIIKSLIEKLIGRKSNPSSLFDEIEVHENSLSIGFSQLNEILLLLGCDRINKAFFYFLSRGNEDIESTAELDARITDFQKLALLFIGNVEQAYSSLSKDDEQLETALEYLKPLEPETLRKRHPPILKIQNIEESKTYYLGYIIEAEINAILANDPLNHDALLQKQQRETIVTLGKRNQEAYLASDHMDVYVATSMREKHEFIQVSRLCDKIFKNDRLADLKLRFFDPTQAYCENRIDKGISEGLMLKRATCTIYMAQESDTLGKDSELATTLAQGKPVVAYIPEGTEQYVRELVDDLSNVQPLITRKQIILGQLKIFDSKLAWDNPEVLQETETQLLDRLIGTVKSYYDRRAKTLSETHPLGIQVTLRNGVANGVLVVRTIDSCIDLLRAILLNSLEFDIKTNVIGESEYLLLIERMSGCVFRVITSNRSLTRSFWNYYL